MHFRNYGLRKAWLVRYLKSPVSEDPLTSNIVNGPKGCWNLHDSTFIIFIIYSEENWVLVICRILGLFLSTLTADDEYSLLNRDNLRQPIAMQLSKKQKNLCFFSTFLKSRSKFEHFERMMALTAYVFAKLCAVKDVVRQTFKKSRFGRSFDKLHGKRSQTLLRSAQEQLYLIYSSLWRNLSFEKSLLEISKTLGLFVNTFITDDKNSVLNTVNLTLPIQMNLSKKQKNFPHFFLHFKNLDENLNILKNRWPS